MTRREFPIKVKVAAWLRADGRCEVPGCGAKIANGKFIYDHRIPDQLGGEPTLENCQVICRQCDKDKTSKDQGDIAKAKRRQYKHAGIKRPRTILGGKRFNGMPVRYARER